MKRINKFSSLQISVSLHAVVIFIIFLMNLNLLKKNTQVIDLNVYTDPLLAQLSKPVNLNPVKEVQKKPEVVSRKVFGASRKSITTTDSSNISVKSGNTVAKSEDSLELNKNDLESLPLPVADYLITDEPSVIFEPKNKQRTEEARKNGYTGTAKLKILIDEMGIVCDVKLLNSLKYGLNERAIELAKQIKLSPAKINGKAVTVIRDFTITFKATD